MELKEAVEIIKKHQEWRRYNGLSPNGPEMVNPTKLGIAIDTVIDYLSPISENENKKAVDFSFCRYPEDVCERQCIDCINQEHWGHRNIKQ